MAPDRQCLGTDPLLRLQFAQLPRRRLPCIAKRSALAAAHLCDAVLPLCPYRQWILSLPFALRYRLIRDSALFSRAVSTFVRTVFSWQRRQAKALGLKNVHTGSVTFAQRYGSLLQLTPHCHSWLPDGVFVQTEDKDLRFVRLPAPTDEDVDKLCARIRQRVLRLCDTDDELSEVDVNPDDAVIATVQAEAIRAPVRRPHFFEQQPAASEQKRTPLSAQHDGFSLHAGLWVKADDRRTLEDLLLAVATIPFVWRETFHTVGTGTRGLSDWRLARAEENTYPRIQRKHSYSAYKANLH